MAHTQSSTPDNSQEPRWRRLPEERPRQIIDAAFEVFGEHGLANARLEEIANRAGVSKGTIYLYFPNKEALFAEVIRQKIVSELEARAEGLGHKPPVDELRDYLFALWDGLRNPNFERLYRLIMSELHHFPELMRFYVREVVVRSQGIIAGIVRRGVDSQDFRAIDPDAAARMISAILVKHAVWCGQREHFSHMERLSDDLALRQMLDFIFHALLSNPAATDAALSK
jgi:AcrR family transcriptional regulator